MDPLTRYRAMREISSQMLAAAQANDWQELAALERKMSSQREALRVLGVAGLSPTDRGKASELIREILEEDLRIREIVEPWLDSLRTLLERPPRRRDLQSTYGALSRSP